MFLFFISIVEKMTLRENHKIWLWQFFENYSQAACEIIIIIIFCHINWGVSFIEKCQVIGKNMKAPADSDVWDVKDEKFWIISKNWKPTFKWVIYGWLHELKIFACNLFLDYIQQPSKTFQAEFTTQVKITTHVSLPSK